MNHESRMRQLIDAAERSDEVAASICEMMVASEPAKEWPECAVIKGIDVLLSDDGSDEENRHTAIEILARAIVHGGHRPIAVRHGVEKNRWFLNVALEPA